MKVFISTKYTKCENILSEQYASPISCRLYFIPPQKFGECVMLRKIRLKEGNAKCRHIWKWPRKRLCGSCLLVWVSNINRSPPPLLTVYVHVLIHRGKGKRGSVEPERRERGNRRDYRSQSRVENTNMTECTQGNGYLQSINSLCWTWEKADDYILA